MTHLAFLTSCLSWDVPVSSAGYTRQLMRGVGLWSRAKYMVAIAIAFSLEHCLHASGQSLLLIALMNETGYATN